jgi:hypothetical protein
VSKKGVRPNRCPYCGRKCDGLACAQHRDLIRVDVLAKEPPK